MKTMNSIKVTKTLFAVAALAFAAAGAQAQSSDLTLWTQAGDAQVSSSTAVLTTASAGSGETPISANSALLYYSLESALAMPGATAGDTIEGSGLQQSFTAAAGTTISFSWTLSTDDYASAATFGALDRAFVVLDGATALDFATIAASPLSGSYSYTFTTAGVHAFAIVVMDVLDSAGVSTLTVSNVNVSAVPEPASIALLLAGLGVVAGAARARRRC